MNTSVILLGAGTPNAEPQASGPAAAVTVDGRAYLVDFGPGVVRQCAKAYRRGAAALHPKNLDLAFCTHLHTDHTAGYPDLIFTPWVLEREKPLRVFGPKGIREMTSHILKAYETDINFRINGFERANPTGYQVEAAEVSPGIIWKDPLVQVEAIPVSHGSLECYAYKFVTPDKTILISGDTCPLDLVAEKARGCDLLLHEVEYAKGLLSRTPQWRKYHSEVHTMSTDLARIAKLAAPKLLVTYHRIYHLDLFSTKFDVEEEIRRREEAILDEIQTAGYDGPVVNGHDLDIF